MLTEDTKKPFEDRRLDPEVAETLGARFRSGLFQFDYRTPDGVLLYQKFGRPDGWEGKPRYWRDPSDTRTIMWGLDQIPLFEYGPDATLIITEGEKDRIAVTQSLAEECYVLSVPDGAQKKERTTPGLTVAEDTGFAWLWGADGRLIKQIEQFNKVILFTDSDEAGLILRDELALRIGETRCWFVSYPKGCKDANDALIKYGEAGVVETFRRAKPMRTGHLMKFSDVPKRSMDIAYSSGFGFLDKHLMIVRPELMVVTGPPGHGKGQFTRCLAGHLAEAHGWKTAFLTPEDPAHRVKRDLTRFSLRKTPHATPEQQAAQQKWLDDHFLVSMPPEDEPITIDMVMMEMELAALQHDCQVFILDPWNEVTRDFSQKENETQYIERILVELKRKMRRLNLLLIICAHPRKPQNGEPVSLYSINGSANWRNKCDHGLVLSRPTPSSNGVQLSVEKSKDHLTMGIPGSMWLEFRKDKCDYEPGTEYVPPPKKKRGERQAALASDKVTVDQGEPIMDTRYGAVI